MLVDAVNKNYSRLAVFVGKLGDLIEDFPRVGFAYLNAVMRIDQRILFALDHLLHKQIGDRDGNIKVGDIALFFFALDKF